MPKGTVKWFNEKKGYGFIKQDDGQDIFVHFSSITMSGFKTLTEGDEVTYDIEDGNRGPVAKNVARAQGSSDVAEAPVAEEAPEA
ncbi:MAG: cold shock domain-containing protein, partial [Candidatus Aminicenantes bacterium]|nr:cold shock domain-containing protein [Candidatus Aminicenantes bacterium]